jgi:hypothetical protein
MLAERPAPPPPSLHVGNVVPPQKLAARAECASHANVDENKPRIIGRASRTAAVSGSVPGIRHGMHTAAALIEPLPVSLPPSLAWASRSSDGGAYQPRVSGAAPRASGGFSSAGWCMQSAAPAIAEPPPVSLLPRSAACVARNSVFKPRASGGALPLPTQLPVSRAAASALHGSKLMVALATALTVGVAAMAIQRSMPSRDRPRQPIPPPFTPRRADDDDVDWQHMSGM